ncbi:hypothetical protein ACKKBG_A28865 [Auxenochlorella protothecoides x Auxenochlorella symbiontica]
MKRGVIPGAQCCPHRSKDGERAPKREKIPTTDYGLTSHLPHPKDSKTTIDEGPSHSAPSPKRVVPIPEMPLSPFARAPLRPAQTDDFMSPPSTKQGVSQHNMRTPPSLLPTPPIKTAPCPLGPTPSFSSWMLDASSATSAPNPSSLRDVIACLPGQACRNPPRPQASPSALDRLLADPALDDLDYGQRVAAWDKGEQAVVPSRTGRGHKPTSPRSHTAVSMRLAF